MIGSSKYISNILIWKIKDTCSSNISDNGNFSNEVNIESTCSNSCLRNWSHWSYVRIKWNPPETAIPSESLYKSRVWIIVHSCVTSSNKWTRKDHPSSILRPNTAKNRTFLIRILKNIIWTNNLRNACWISMIESRPANISKPKISWKVSCTINGWCISTIGWPNIKHYISRVSERPRRIRNKKSVNIIQTWCREGTNKRKNRKQENERREKEFTFHEKWICFSCGV